MKYIKRPGIHVVTIKAVAQGSDNAELAKQIKAGLRTDYISLSVTNTDGESATIKFFLPKNSDGPKALEFKKEKINKFLWSFDKKFDDSNNYDLAQLSSDLKGLVGQSFKGLFRETEYLKEMPDGKMYLNSYMEFMWGRKLDQELEANQSYLHKRLNPGDQEKWEQYQKAQNRTEQDVQEEFTQTDEDDDLPF